MRIDTLKFLFMGMQSEKSTFFEQAQEEGIIQFIPGEVRPAEGFPSVDAALKAIKIVRGLPPLGQEETDDDSLVEQILALKNQLDHLEEERRYLNLEIARVGVFGDFSLEDVKEIERLGNRKIQFYCAKTGAEVPECMLYVASNQGLDYYTAIHEKPASYEGMIELIIDRPLGALQNRLKQVVADIHQAESALKRYAKYNAFLHKIYFYEWDSQNLSVNKRYAVSQMEGELFAVEGWVPATHVDRMHALVDSLGVVAEQIAVEETDTAPTCLENEGMHRVGEDLVHIYDTPSNTDKDPSFWVLAWFSLFFAMIIGDAGYGLIFLLSALYIGYRVRPKKPLGKRFFKLAVLLSTVCIGWGVLTNAFFGMGFSPDHPLRRHSMITWLSKKKIGYMIENRTPAYMEMTKKYPQLASVKDPATWMLEGTRERDGDVIYDLADSTASGIMMELALFIGVAHILFGMGRYVTRNKASIGWMIVIVGGLLYIPFYLRTPSLINYVFGLPASASGREGLYLMGAGFTLAVSLSLYQHKWLGILEPLTIIQIFSDILSYLRLYALGLAGGIVGATVNGLVYGLDPILAGIAIVIGHAVNILLAIMGGTIHGLRLNFLEWYHYSFEGGGKRYNPLRKLAKENT